MAKECILPYMVTDKMELSGWVLSAFTSVLRRKWQRKIRQRKEEDRDTQGRQCEDGDWNDVARSRGTPRNANSHEKPEEARKRFFPGAFRGSRALLTP